MATKNMYLEMHNALPKRLPRIFKTPVEGLQLVEPFQQLAQKYIFHKQVSNIQIEIYLMYLIFFSKFYS